MALRRCSTIRISYLVHTEGIIMSHKKADRLSIQPRDKSTVAHPRAAISHECSHAGQVKNAFDFAFTRYEKAMKDLSKV